MSTSSVTSAGLTPKIVAKLAKSNPKKLQRVIVELLKGARPKRWSYSAYATHVKCPRALGLSYIIKTQQAPNEAMKRGIDLHKQAEWYLKGELDKVPKLLLPLKREVMALRKMEPVVEQFWNADKKFGVAKDYQGWCVLKMDAFLPPTRSYNLAWMADHKTGREYPEHGEQAELSAVFMFGRHPKIDAADFEFWYYDTGDPPLTFSFPRSELLELKDKWQDRGNEVMAERKFLPTPSINACKFCVHRSDKGGACLEWKRAK
jgi:hypothetical protein